MARIRTIKPEFWIDEKIVDLDPWARLLFIGMWNFADDHGYLDDKPKRIKMQIFPNDDVEVEKLITELVAAELITPYDSPIGPVLYVRNWSRHQRVDRPAQRRFSEDSLSPREHSSSPREGSLANVETGGNRTFDEPSTSPRESSLASVDAEGKGREGKGTSLSPIRESETETSEPSAKADVMARPEVEELCLLLADKIEANGYKRPTITKQWRTDCRLMIDKEDRPPENIRKAIEWATNDEFWRPNIRSMAKLREHYDVMRDRARQEQHRSKHPPLRESDVDGWGAFSAD